MINRIRLLLIEFYNQNQSVILFLGKALGLYFLWNILYHGFLIQWGINDPLTRWVAMSASKICQIFDVKHEYFRENNAPVYIENNKVKGNIFGNNYGNVYQCPDELIESIKQLIADYQKGK